MIDSTVGSMVGWITGKAAGWRGECWADELTGLTAGSRVGWMSGEAAS